MEETESRCQSIEGLQWGRSNINEVREFKIQLFLHILSLMIVLGRYTMKT